MSQRPSLKLKLSAASNLPTQQSLSDSPTSTPKLILKFGGTPKSAVPPPSQEEALTKTKAPRKPKKAKPPRLSTPASKKRSLAVSTHSDDDGNEGPSTSQSVPLPAIKKIKLNTRAPSTPFIRMKAKGKPPHRPLGVGYDSESSDREIDPAIEEEFILRMAPGPDCDYLQQAVTEKRFGPRNEGGADVRMRFLTRDGRRAVVTIKGRHYAACLVDLPCVVEGMKSWDRRGWWKSADVCQMLLVLGRIEKEDEANSYTLPARDIDPKTWQYAHGLTPPMRWVRKRRFRKRVSNRTIEAVEEEVERLCRADEDCVGESHYEVLDLDRLTREQSARDSEADGGYDMLGNAGMEGESDYGDQDAEGDVDDTANGYFHPTNAEDDMDDGLAADLERAMMQDDDDDEATASETPSALPYAPPLPLSTPTSAAATPSKYDSGDEESSDADEDDPADEIDEDVLEQQQDMLRQREEIADLEAAIKGQSAELERVQNSILKQKLVRKIQSLQADLEVKMAAIGEGERD
ncbi:hypothetical protein MMC12_007989 [Toensbergia leucococca]|nr:hypothetical protein [Toensbergia leucococca]